MKVVRILWWKKASRWGNLELLTRNQAPTENALMTHSTLATVLLATPFLHELFPLVERLLPLLRQLATLLLEFRSQPITPSSTAALEHSLQSLLREVGRVILEWLFNSLEPDPLLFSPRLRLRGTEYRRRKKSPITLATLFGTIVLQRLLYEPLDAGERCFFPLHHRLGIAVNATPALASSESFRL